MNRQNGLSLVETMVSLGIVSVVGLGMYSGFTSLDEAVKQNKALVDAQQARTLLIPLLESDLALHGTGVDNPSPGPACLVHYDHALNEWLSSCEGNLVPLPAPGVVTCRQEAGKNQKTLTLTYRLTSEDLKKAGMSGDVDNIRQQFAGTATPLDWAWRRTWQADTCNASTAYLNTNLDFRNGISTDEFLRNIIDSNVATLGFSNDRGNYTVSFEPNIAQVLVTNGNQTVIEEVVLPADALSDVAPIADDPASLPTVSFYYDSYLLKPEGEEGPYPVSAAVPILIDSPPTTDLTIGWKITGSSSSTGTYEFEAGSRLLANSPPELRVGQSISLYSSQQYFLGEHPTASARSTMESDNTGDKPRVRLIVDEDRVQRIDGSEGIAFYIVSDRPIPENDDETPIVKLRYQSGECRDGLSCECGATSDFNIQAINQFGLPIPSSATASSAPYCTDSSTGELQVLLSEAFGPRNEIEFNFTPNADTSQEPATISIDLLTDPDGKYIIEGPSSGAIDMVNSGLLPEVSFLITDATAIEPVEGEERNAQLVLRFDPPTSKPISVLLNYNAPGPNRLTCGVNGNYVVQNTDGIPLTYPNPYNGNGNTLSDLIEPISDYGFTLFNHASAVAGSCLNVGDEEDDRLLPIGIPASTSEQTLLIELNPSSMVEHSNQLEIDIAVSPTYTIGDSSSATVTLEEYSRVRFTAASSVVDEDIHGTLGSSNNGWPTGSSRPTLNLEIDPPAIGDLTAYFSIIPGDPGDSNALNASIPGDVRFTDGTYPAEQSIQITSGTSSYNLPYEIQNDVLFDRGKRFHASISRVSGQGLPGITSGANSIPPSELPLYSTLIEITDQDLCPIGAGLTSGQSPLNHFHSRGNSLLDDAEIGGATVRIESGYDSANDRLILAGYDGVESGNSITYNSLDYSHVVRGMNDLFVPSSGVLNGDLVQGVYEFDALFTVEQGVLELEIESNPDGDATILAPLMVKFMRDVVNYRNVGTGSGNRSVTFTLGSDVQAWDGHEDGTTHYYKFVPFESGNALSWTASRDEAKSEANQFFGNTGYLATITSEAENQFIQTRFNLGGGNPNGWAGGASKVAGAGETSDWYWTEGPEGQESGGLGRWWWRGGNGSNGKAENWVRTDNTEGLSNANCSNTGPDGQPMTGVQRLLFGYSETTNSNDDVVPDSTRRYAMWRCQGNGNRQEPNGAYNEARGLKIIGGLASNQTWNDERQSFTNYQYSKGYYVEYGGPEKSGFGIRNLKLSQTSTFSATGCGVDHGAADSMCRAWPDLTAGFGSSNSAGDFYSSQNGLNTQARVVDATRGRVNLYINHENYNKLTDRLVLVGANPTSNDWFIDYSAVPAGETNATISGRFFIEQGLLQLSVDSGTAPTGAQWANVLNRLVEYQNPGDPNSNDYSIERSITYTLGDGTVWPFHPDGTAHVYRYVESENNWNDADTNASATTTNYFNEVGHLATVTSQEEHEFLSRNLPRPNGRPPIGWLGGTDVDNEGVWVWADGPEQGQQFWQGALLNGQPILSGNGMPDTSFTLPTCEDQRQDRDSSDHVDTVDVHILDVVGNSNMENSPHRFTKWSCAPNDLQRPEPSGLETGNQEDWLILSATRRGGETWNDTLLNSTNDESWLNITGYFQEFGGDNEFFNRSTSQTFNVSPAQCVMTRNTATAGCLPGDGLTVGTSSQNDFYGPQTEVSNANITQARVKIQSGFVSNGISDRDELALRGATGTLINDNRTRRYEDVPLTYGNTMVDVNGEYDFVTGVLRVTAESAVPARDLVGFLSQRVQLVAAGSSTAPKDISFTLGDALIWTGHEDGAERYYRFVEYPTGANRTWGTAREAARSSSEEYFGVPGYLATITSKAENDFIAGSFARQGSPVAGWLGGSDNRLKDGTWEWVSGPEGGNTTSAGNNSSNRMQFWEGEEGSGTKPVNLEGSAINGTPPTSGSAQLTGSSGCADADAACCRDQYSAYHGQTASEATAAATLLGQSGTVLKHHFFGYSETVDGSGNVTLNPGKRFANWSCNGNTEQPSNSGSGGQKFLLITGSPLGGGMWNDVADGGITAADTANIYLQQGYYVEYGGGGTWQDNFDDRRIGRVVRIPVGCEMPAGGFSRID